MDTIARKAETVKASLQQLLVGTGRDSGFTKFIKDLLDSVYDVPNENDRKELLGIAEKLWNDRISNDGKTPVEFDIR